MVKEPGDCGWSQRTSHGSLRGWGPQASWFWGLWLGLPWFPDTSTTSSAALSGTRDLVLGWTVGSAETVQTVLRAVLGGQVACHCCRA